MRERSWEVQKAVMVALDGDSTLLSLLSAGSPSPIYDDVPQESSYPYVVIGDDTAIPYDTVTTDGMEATITIHIWSEYRGWKETKEIRAQIIETLDKATLILGGGTMINMHAEFVDAFRDPDGITRHGVVRFRIVTEE